MQLENNSKGQNNAIKKSALNDFVPEGPSLCSLLVQGLSNKDNEVLKFVLNNSDQEVISLTIEALQDERLYKALAETLAARLESFPNETVCLLRWIDIFLKKKASLCKERSEIILPLKQKADFFTSKESLLLNLIRLKGKLSFVLEQSKSVAESDKYVSKSFGVPRVLVDERDQISLSNNEQEEYPKGISRKQKSKGRQPKKNESNGIGQDSFDEMFDEEAFEEAAEGEEDEHELDPELEAEEEMLYDEEFSDEQDMNQIIEEDENDKIELEEEKEFSDNFNEEISEEDKPRKKVNKKKQILSIKEKQKIKKDKFGKKAKSN